MGSSTTVRRYRDLRWSPQRSIVIAESMWVLASVALAVAEYGRVSAGFNLRSVNGHSGGTVTVADLLRHIVGDDIPIRVTAFDGSSLGPADATTTVDVVSPDALRRIAGTRGQELGFSRSIVAGEIEIHGDVFGLFDVSDRVKRPSIDRRLLRSFAESLGIDGWRDLAQLRPPPPPPEEIQLKGRLHSRRRDAEAISRHYDVSNDFYDLVLGDAMTYSCAVFESEHDDLESAQTNKHDLVCRKLGLEPGMRLLDVGCGWGSMVLHAAEHYGVQAVGVTISNEQADRARKRVAEAGLADAIEIRVQDYRDVPDGPFDAISSIGMSEHVGGPEQLHGYFSQMRALLAVDGRFLNHAISRAPGEEPAGPGGFIQRYVFPDGELHEIGATISALQTSGFEARHMESFRLHYATTLREWVANLEDQWEVAVDLVGRGRATVWRLYMAGSAVAFERGAIQLHQVLAMRDDADNASIPALNDWSSRRN